MAASLFTSNFKNILIMQSGGRITKNTFLYFTGKLLLLFLIVFVLDFAIGQVMRYYFYKQECGRQYRAIYALDKTKADVLIFGSSTAYHHYKPPIIAARLKETCYNVGSPGQGVLFDYALLKSVLKRYTPRLIILDVNLREFKYSKDSYDKLSFLLPFYKEHEEIRPIVDLKSSLEKYKLWSSIYAFNSSFLIIAGGNSSYYKKRYTDVDGYKPLTRVWDKPMEDWDLYEYQFDTVKINMFKVFVDDCRKAGTRLLIVCSPKYIIFHEKEVSIAMIEKIARDKKVDYLDFVNDTTFTNHREYFDDAGHLNTQGSEFFTNLIVDKLDSLKLH
jgi:hypothetical protein